VSFYLSCSSVEVNLNTLKLKKVNLNHNGLGRQGLPSVRGFLRARTCISDSVIKDENVVQIVWNEHFTEVL